jgi:uncharacterized protein (TIGR03067 family)
VVRPLVEIESQSTLAESAPLSSAGQEKAHGLACSAPHGTHCQPRLTTYNKRGVLSPEKPALGLAMNRSLPLVLLAGLGVAAGSSPQEEVKAELKRLEGTWKVVAMELGGKKLPPEKAQRLGQIIITRDRLVLQEADKKETSMGLKIDPAKKPNAMDLRITRGKESIDWKCIYDLQGDDLKICMPLARKKGDSSGGSRDLNVRPESFVTEGRPLMLITARREVKK